MNEINTIESENTVKTVSSLEIAELTGKRHSDVIRDIKNILNEAEIGERRFALSYLSSQNKELPCYHLPRRECDLVISGYSVKYRLAIIDRWQELENQIQIALPDFTNPAIAARAWADEVEQKQIALSNLNTSNKEIENMTPTYNFGKAVEAANTSMTIRAYAKYLSEDSETKIGPNKLLKVLRQSGYLLRTGEDRNAPLQKYINQGLFTIKSYNVPKTNRIQTTTMITIKGQSKLATKIIAYFKDLETRGL